MWLYGHPSIGNARDANAPEVTDAATSVGSVSEPHVERPVFTIAEATGAVGAARECMLIPALTTVAL